MEGRYARFFFDFSGQAVPLTGPAIQGPCDQFDLGEGHLWLIDLTRAMPADRRPRPPSCHGPPIRRLDRAELRRRRRAAESQIISKYIDSAAGASIFHDRHGKPFLLSSALRISLSDTNGLLALAISSGDVIGVDIEADVPTPDALIISQCFFSERETEALAALRGRDRDRAFLFSWTLKEAALKAVGSGLMAPLDSVITTVHPRPGGQVRLITLATPPWPQPPQRGFSFQCSGLLGAVVGGPEKWRIIETRWKGHLNRVEAAEAR